MPAELKVIEFPGAAPKKKKKRKLRKYERADGRFCKYVTINGVKKPIYGTSTDDVIKKAAEYKELMTHGLSNLDYDIRVETWCDTWFNAEMAGKKHGYRRNVERQLRLIKEQIGHLKVKAVREIHLQSVLNSRSGMSKSQIQQLRNAIKNLFSSARKNHLIIIDPSLDLSSPKGTYNGHRALEQSEIDFLLENADIHRSMIWALTMLFTGLRRGELIALKTRNIDFAKRVIHVENTVEFENGRVVDSDTTKTEAGVRTVPLYEPLYSILKRDLEENPREYLAVQQSGERLMSEGGFRGQWATLLRRLTHVNSGYPAHLHVVRTPEEKAAFEATLLPIAFTPHDLRYTYATLLYDSGVDEKTACLYMGHTDPRMTRDLYAQLSAARAAKSDRKLEAHLHACFVTKQLTEDTGT